MFRFWRGRRRARTTIPVFRASMRQTFWPSVLQVLAIPVLSAAALMWFGQPALRFQYWYYGPDSNPVYQRCLYLAFDGWHFVLPNGGGRTDLVCPIVKMIPVRIADLL